MLILLGMIFYFKSFFIGLYPILMYIALLGLLLLKVFFRHFNIESPERAIYVSIVLSPMKTINMIDYLGLSSWTNLFAITTPQYFIDFQCFMSVSQY
jgi:hypothetical protein